MRVLGYRRFGVGAAVMAGALVVGAALAQPAVPTYPECTKKPTKEDIEGAKGAHKAATQFYDRGDYDKAIRYWGDAYGFDCTATDLLINIANAYEKKGDLASSVATLDAYLKRTGPNPTLEEKVKNLKTRLAPPTPTATATTTTTAIVPPLPTASATTAPTVPPPAEGPRPFGYKPWFLVGGGGALAVVGAILLPIGFGNVSSADSACPTRLNCAQNIADQGNSGRTEAAAGGALLGIGLAAAAGGLVWQFAANKPGPPAAGGTPHTAATNLWLLPMAGRGTSGLTAGGSF